MIMTEIVLLAVFALLALVAVMVWAILRCRYPRYEYAALDDESSFLSDRMELSRKFHGDIDRNEALVNCQYYLRGSTRYFLRYQLNNIGSRMDRHWFVVRDNITRTERLLTVTALPEACPVRHGSCHTRPSLQEIFLGLQHPYVHPVLDIDIKVLAERPHVVVISPLNSSGSLKDLIYHSKYNEDWQEKYRPNGLGLPKDQIQRLSKQIMEGMLFLHRKDFPAFYNLHLGNIILQNGVARLTGVENALLGYIPRIASFVKKKIWDNREIVDAVCFGHALFEMTAGYELSTMKPTDKNYLDVEHCAEVYQVLRFIFEGRFPSLTEVASLDFFRNIDLREMRSQYVPPVLQIPLSSAARHLLRDVQKFYRNKGKRRPCGSISSSYSSQESLDSRCSSRQQLKKRANSQHQCGIVLKKPCPPPSSAQLLSLDADDSESNRECRSAAPKATMGPPGSPVVHPNSTPSTQADASSDPDLPPPAVPPRPITALALDSHAPPNDQQAHNPETSSQQSNPATTIADASTTTSNKDLPSVERDNSACSEPLPEPAGDSTRTRPPFQRSSTLGTSPGTPPPMSHWVQSQSSISTGTSYEYTTPPSSPLCDVVEFKPSFPVVRETSESYFGQGTPVAEQPGECSLHTEAL
ncbi:slowpoke-binding protein-like isoform X2 [Ornithodoros turicata]|uniref:slowpoke-binding protein-like isoform X2 n=1 Tax=Ornithodoros turicata TaxID=34597 RepID=UPI00313861AC